MTATPAQPPVRQARRELIDNVDGLHKVLLAVAGAVLDRPVMAARREAGLDAAELVRQDPLALARLLPASAALRERVSRQCPLPPAPRHEGTVGDLARRLLSDGQSAAAAADFEALAAAAGAAAPGRPPRQRNGQPHGQSSAPAVTPEPVPAGRGSSEPKKRERAPAADKQLKYAERRVSEARTQAERMRGQLDNTQAELRAAVQRAQSAESDASDLEAELLAARSDVAAARRQTADVHAAAHLLLVASQPAPTPVSDDPREAEQAMLAGLSAPAADLVTDVPGNADLAAALAAAGVGPAAWRSVLEALLNPPVAVVAAPARTAQREFVVTPLGGGEEIGGSCILVEVGDTRLLVDVGMRPKERMSEAGPPLIDVALAGRIDAIVITHAHNDHAGYVPAVLAAQPGIPVFTTTSTAALLSTMWADSISVFGHQAREDASRAAASPTSRINGGLLQAARDNPAPYTTEQWRHARERVEELEFGRPVTVRGGVTLELFPAGHILGACGVVIGADGRRVTVTGDVSDLQQASVPGLVVPDAAVGSDLLVIESTYCRRPVSSRAWEIDGFLTTVRETVEAGGRVLVPAFALGRAQEVALLLRERLADVPVLIDGMARQISEIYQEQTAALPRPLAIFGDNVGQVVSSRRDHTIATFRRGVVVTTSGMLSAGPALPWARAILPDPASALLIAGYQDEESPGAALLRLADGPAESRQWQLDGRPVQVGARVAKFSLSAHADRSGLTSIIDRVDPARVMLVHGNRGPQADYRAVLNARGNRTVPTGVWAAP